MVETEILLKDKITTKGNHRLKTQTIKFTSTEGHHAARHNNDHVKDAKNTNSSQILSNLEKLLS